MGVALSVALGVDGVCMCMSGCMAGCRYTECVGRCGFVSGCVGSCVGVLYALTPYMTLIVCAALLKKMLRISPSKRYSVKEIKEHIWYKK